MSFVLERTAFAYYDGKLYVQDPGDSRTSKQWLFEILGVTRKGWEESVRGYLRSGRIQFYTGEDYRPVDEVSDEMVEELKGVHRKLYHHSAVGIFNGVIPGALDTPWDPIFSYDPDGGGWYRV